MVRQGACVGPVHNDVGDFNAWGAPNLLSLTYKSGDLAGMFGQETGRRCVLPLQFAPSENIREKK